jgi:hypothetical protein
MYCRFLQFGCKVTKKNKKRELQRKKITVANKIMRQLPIQGNKKTGQSPENGD